MKQKLLKSLFSIVLLMIGINAWAGTATGTINFGTTGVKINDASVSGNDSEGNTWTITTAGTNSYTSNSAYYQVGKADEPATSITFTMTLPEQQPISNFSAKFGGFKGTTGTVTLTIDNATVATGSLNGNQDVTISGSSTVTGKTLTVTVTGIAKGVKCYSISYSYPTEGLDQAAVPELPANVTFNTTPYDIIITNKESGSTVYYTTDGTDPSLSSSYFTGASKTIQISETTTVKAMSVISGKDNSSVASAKYTYDPHQNATITIGRYQNTLFIGNNDTYSIEYDSDGELSAASDDESVVAVSVSGGKVTIIPCSVGSAKITFSTPKTDKYNKTTKSYTVAVKNPSTVPFVFDGGKADITGSDGISGTGLGSTDYSSSPKLKFDDAGDNVVVCFNNQAKYVYYKLKGNSAGSEAWAGQVDVLESADGINYSTIKSYTELTEVADYYPLSSASRFVKFVYTKKTAGNVGLGAIEISNNEPQTTVSVGSTGYATYYNSKHSYIMPTGCEGWIAYWNNKFVFEKAYSAGDIVPAGVALVLKNTGDYTLKYTKEAGTKPAKNYLSGTDVETDLTATAKETWYYYALTLNADNDPNSVGFYWMNSTGAAFTNGANKAYLTISKNNFPTEAKTGFAFNEEVTAINNINTDVNATSPVFNLAGQRVNSNAKGIVIMNGKKMVVK